VNVEAEDADASAMLRLQNGDDLALSEIMERWQTRVLSYFLRLAGDQTLASDLAEETFVQVYQSRRRYRPDGAFSNWLFGIAANLFRDHARRYGRHSTVSIDAMTEPNEKPLSERIYDSRPDPERESELTERSAAVRNALLSLPEEQRQAIELFEHEGFSHEEIAHIAGCTPKAIETRLYRARGILREKLKGLLE
jgi:RNA polymerase sigma-70 factor, ECF subfamily